MPGAIPEPTTELWLWLRTYLDENIWPSTDEAVVLQLANDWGSAAQAMTDMIDAASAANNELPGFWPDSAGTIYQRNVARTLDDYRTMVQAYRDMEKLCRDFAGQISALRNSIIAELVVNAALFAALAMFPGAGLLMGRFASQLALRLMGYSRAAVAAMEAPSAMVPHALKFAGELLAEGGEEIGIDFLGQTMSIAGGYQNGYNYKQMLISGGAGVLGGGLAPVLMPLGRAVSFPAGRLTNRLGAPPGMTRTVEQMTSAFVVNGITSPVAGTTVQSLADGRLPTLSDYGHAIVNQAPLAGVLASQRIAALNGGVATGNFLRGNGFTLPQMPGGGHPPIPATVGGGPGELAPGGQASSNPNQPGTQQPSIDGPGQQSASDVSQNSGTQSSESGTAAPQGATGTAPAGTSTGGQAAPAQAQAAGPAQAQASGPAQAPAGGQTNSASHTAAGPQNPAATQNAAGPQNATQSAAGPQNSSGTQNAAGPQNTTAQNTAAAQNSAGTQPSSGNQSASSQNSSSQQGARAHRADSDQNTPDLSDTADQNADSQPATNTPDGSQDPAGVPAQDGPQAPADPSAQDGPIDPSVQDGSQEPVDPSAQDGPQGPVDPPAQLGNDSSSDGNPWFDSSTPFAPADPNAPTATSQPAWTAWQSHGPNQARWRYDANGTPRMVQAKLERAYDGSGRNADDAAARKDARERGVPGDQGGHALAWRFFKQVMPGNYFPQTGNLNTGAFKKVENEIAAWLDAGHHVEVTIVFPPGPVRPGSVTVVYTVTDPSTGRTIWTGGRTFVNTRGEKFARYATPQINVFAPGTDNLFQNPDDDTPGSVPTTPAPVPPLTTPDTAATPNTPADPPAPSEATPETETSSDPAPTTPTTPETRPSPAPQPPDSHTPAHPQRPKNPHASEEPEAIAHFASDAPQTPDSPTPAHPERPKNPHASEEPEAIAHFASDAPQPPDSPTPAPQTPAPQTPDSPTHRPERFLPGWVLVSHHSGQLLDDLATLLTNNDASSNDPSHLAVDLASVRHEGNGVYRIRTTTDETFRLVKRVGPLHPNTQLEYSVQLDGVPTVDLQLSDRLAPHEVAPLLARVLAESAAIVRGDTDGPAVFRPDNTPQLHAVQQIKDIGDRAELRQYGLDEQHAGQLRRTLLQAEIHKLALSMGVADGQPNADLLRTLLTQDERAVLDRVTDRGATLDDDRVSRGGYVAKAILSSGWSTAVIGTAATVFTGDPLVGLGIAIPTLVNALVGSMSERYLDAQKQPGKKPAYTEERVQRDFDYPGLHGLLDGPEQIRPPLTRMPRATKWSNYLVRHTTPTLATAAVAGALTLFGVPALSTALVIASSALAKSLAERLVDVKKLDFRLKRVDATERIRLSDPALYSNQLVTELGELQTRLDRVLAALDVRSGLEPTTDPVASPPAGVTPVQPPIPGAPPFRITLAVQLIDNVSAAARRVFVGGQQAVDVDPTELARHVSAQVESLLNAIGPGLFGSVAGAMGDKYFINREEAANDARKQWARNEQEAAQAEALSEIITPRLSDLRQLTEHLETLVGTPPDLAARAADRSLPAPTAPPSGPRPSGQSSFTAYAVQVAAAALGGAVSAIGLDLIFDLPDLGVVLTVAGAAGAMIGTPVARYLFRRTEIDLQAQLEKVLAKQAVDRVGLLEQRAVSRYLVEQLATRAEAITDRANPQRRPGPVDGTESHSTDLIRAALRQAELDNVPPGHPETPFNHDARSERISLLQRIDSLAAAIDQLQALGRTGGPLADLRANLAHAVNLYEQVANSNGVRRAFPDLGSVDPRSGQRVVGGPTAQARAAVDQAIRRLVAEPTGKPLLPERLVALEHLAYAADTVDHHAVHGTDESRALVQSQFEEALTEANRLWQETGNPHGLVLPALSVSPSLDQVGGRVVIPLRSLPPTSPVESDTGGRHHRSDDAAVGLLEWNHTQENGAQSLFGPNTVADAEALATLERALATLIQQGHQAEVTIHRVARPTPTADPLRFTVRLTDPATATTEHHGPFTLEHLTRTLLPAESTGRHHADEAAGQHHADESTGRHHVDKAAGRHHEDEATGRHHAQEPTGRHHVDEPTGRHHVDEPTGRHHAQERPAEYVGRHRPEEVAPPPPDRTQLADRADLPRGRHRAPDAPPAEQPGHPVPGEQPSPAAAGPAEQATPPAVGPAEQATPPAVGPAGQATPPAVGPAGQPVPAEQASPAAVGPAEQTSPPADAPSQLPPGAIPLEGGGHYQATQPTAGPSSDNPLDVAAVRRAAERIAARAARLAPQPALTEQTAPAQATTEQPTTEQPTTEQASTGQSTTRPAAPEQASTGATTTGTVHAEQTTPEQAAIDQGTTGSAATGSATTGSVDAEQTAGEQTAREPAAPEQTGDGPAGPGRTVHAPEVPGTRFVVGGTSQASSDPVAEAVRAAQAAVEGDFGGLIVGQPGQAAEGVVVVQTNGGPQYFKVSRAQVPAGRVAATTVREGSVSKPHLVRISTTLAADQLTRAWVHEISHTLQEKAAPRSRLRRLLRRPSAYTVDLCVAAQFNEFRLLSRQLAEARTDVEIAALRQDLEGLVEAIRPRHTPPQLPWVAGTVQQGSPTEAFVADVTEQVNELQRQLDELGHRIAAKTDAADNAAESAQQAEQTAAEALQAADSGRFARAHQAGQEAAKHAEVSAWHLQVAAAYQEAQHQLETVAEGYRSLLTTTPEQRAHQAADLLNQLTQYEQALAAVAPPLAALASLLPTDWLPHLSALTNQVNAVLAANKVDHRFTPGSLQHRLNAEFGQAVTTDGAIMRVGHARPIELRFRLSVSDLIEVLDPSVRASETMLGLLPQPSRKFGITQNGKLGASGAFGLSMLTQLFGEHSWVNAIGQLVTVKGEQSASWGRSVTSNGAQYGQDGAVEDNRGESLLYAGQASWHVQARRPGVPDRLLADVTVDRGQGKDVSRLRAWASHAYTVLAPTKTFTNQTTPGRLPNHTLTSLDGLQSLTDQVFAEYGDQLSRVGDQVREQIQAAITQDLPSRLAESTEQSLIRPLQADGRPVGHLEVRTEVRYEQVELVGDTSTAHWQERVRVGFSNASGQQNFSASTTLNATVGYGGQALTDLGDTTIDLGPSATGGRSLNRSESQSGGGVGIHVGVQRYTGPTQGYRMVFEHKVTLVLDGESQGPVTGDTEALVRLHTNDAYRHGLPVAESAFVHDESGNRVIENGVPVLRGDPRTGVDVPGRRLELPQWLAGGTARLTGAGPGLAQRVTGGEHALADLTGPLTERGYLPPLDDQGNPDLANMTTDPLLRQGQLLNLTELRTQLSVNRLEAGYDIAVQSGILVTLTKPVTGHAAETLTLRINLRTGPPSAVGVTTDEAMVTLNIGSDSASRTDGWSKSLPWRASPLGLTQDAPGGATGSTGVSYGRQALGRVMGWFTGGTVNQVTLVESRSPVAAFEVPHRLEVTELGAEPVVLHRGTPGTSARILVDTDLLPSTEVTPTQVSDGPVSDQLLDRATLVALDTHELNRLVQELGGHDPTARHHLAAFLDPRHLLAHPEWARTTYRTDALVRGAGPVSTRGSMAVHGRIGDVVLLGTSDAVVGDINLALTSHGLSAGRSTGGSTSANVGANADGQGGKLSGEYGTNTSASRTDQTIAGVERLTIEVGRHYLFAGTAGLAVTANGKPVAADATVVFQVAERDVLRFHLEGELTLPLAQVADAVERYLNGSLELDRRLATGLVRQYRAALAAAEAAGVQLPPVSASHTARALLEKLQPQRGRPTPRSKSEQLDLVLDQAERVDATRSVEIPQHYKENLGSSLVEQASVTEQGDQVALFDKVRALVAEQLGIAPDSDPLLAEALAADLLGKRWWGRLEDMLGPDGFARTYPVGQPGQFGAQQVGLRIRAEFTDEAVSLGTTQKTISIVQRYLYDERTASATSGRSLGAGVDGSLQEGRTGSAGTDRSGSTAVAVGEQTTRLERIATFDGQHRVRRGLKFTVEVAPGATATPARNRVGRALSRTESPLTPLAPVTLDGEVVQLIPLRMLPETDTPALQRRTDDQPIGSLNERGVPDAFFVEDAKSNELSDLILQELTELLGQAGMRVHRPELAVMLSTATLNASFSRMAQQDGFAVLRLPLPGYASQSVEVRVGATVVGAQLIAGPVDSVEIGEVNRSQHTVTHTVTSGRLLPVDGGTNLEDAGTGATGGVTAGEQLADQTNDGRGVRRERSRFEKGRVVTARVEVEYDVRLVKQDLRRSGEVRDVRETEVEQTPRGVAYLTMFESDYQQLEQFLAGSDDGAPAATVPDEEAVSYADFEARLRGETTPLYRVTNLVTDLDDDEDDRFRSPIARAAARNPH